MALKGMVTSFIKAALRRHDVKIARINARSDPAHQLKLMLETNGVDLVLDVGANTGQFAAELREVGYRGRIVSFEPLKAAHATLSENARGDSAWQVAPRMAIGDHNGELTINVSANSVSSSILPMLDSHSSVEKDSKYVRQETANIRRLDAVVGEFLRGSKRVFVKIDTQGYEWHVLDGMSGIWPQVVGVTCELSLVHLYKGQRLWKEVVERMGNQGFEIWAFQQGFTDMRGGRCLQVDGVFFRVVPAPA